MLDSNAANAAALRALSRYAYHHVSDESSNLPVLVLPPVATSLDRARRGQLVYVDSSGEVRSPTSLRARNFGIYALCGTVTAAGVFFAWATVPIAIPVYLALGGRFFSSVTAVHKLNDASVALSLGDSVGAKKIAEPISKAWYLPKRLRALAQMRVAAADAMQGKSETALELIRKARQALPTKSIQYQISFYFEVNLLAAMGRVKDARAVLVGRGKLPEGEVLRVTHWLAELHVCCAEGSHEIEQPELFDRARKGLAMNAGGDLLLLCAWAFDILGDREQVIFLLHEAKQRDRTTQIDVTMPSLAAWLTKQPTDQVPSSDYLIE
jgi:hypothetical protein